MKFAIGDAVRYTSEFDAIVSEHMRGHWGTISHLYPEGSLVWREGHAPFTATEDTYLVHWHIVEFTAITAEPESNLIRTPACVRG